MLAKGSMRPRTGRLAQHSCSTGSFGWIHFSSYLVFEPGESAMSISTPWLTPGIHPGRTAGGHCHHRRSGRLALARGASGARSGPSVDLRQQATSDWLGQSALPFHVQRLPPRPRRATGNCRTIATWLREGSREHHRLGDAACRSWNRRLPTARYDFNKCSTVPSIPEVACPRRRSKAPTWTTMPSTASGTRCWSAHRIPGPAKSSATCQGPTIPIALRETPIAPAISSRPAR